MERFPFDRLIRAVDGVRDELEGEPIFMQTGHAAYTPNCGHQAFLSFEEMREKIGEARIVVGHAGAGTLLMCSMLGKVPIMMARKGCFGEHVDDHQQMLAERMAKRGAILLANEPEDIGEYILGYAERLRARGNKGKSEAPLAHHLKELLREIAS